jgi:hypothetical protein
MKVVCIKPFSYIPGIRYGVIYDGVITPDTSISVIDDFGKIHVYKNERFITLEKWREKQLMELGI